MKKGLAVALVIMAVAFSASANVPVKVKVTEEKSLYLFFGEISGKVWISFVDQAGYTLYSNRLKEKKSYSVQYDLQSLPDGTYALVLEDGTQTKTLNVVIIDGKVSVSREVAFTEPVSYINLK